MKFKWEQWCQSRRITYLTYLYYIGVHGVSHRLVAVHPEKDGIIRVVDVNTRCGIKKRAALLICPLPNQPPSNNVYLHFFCSIKMIPFTYYYLLYLYFIIIIIFILNILCRWCQAINISHLCKKINILYVKTVENVLRGVCLIFDIDMIIGISIYCEKHVSTGQIKCSRS